MKIKEVSAGVKISKNYDSYQAGLVAELEIGESTEKVGAELMEKALEIVSKKIELNNIDSKEELTEIEVGAAWVHKKSNALLSIKMNETEDWEHIKLSDLEKTKDGFKQKINDETFIFRRIPEGKRRNNKMPVFRIYNERKNED